MWSCTLVPNFSQTKQHHGIQEINADCMVGMWALRVWWRFLPQDPGTNNNCSKIASLSHLLHSSWGVHIDLSDELSEEVEHKYVPLVIMLKTLFVIFLVWIINSYEFWSNNKCHNDLFDLWWLSTYGLLTRKGEAVFSQTTHVNPVCVVTEQSENAG